MKKKKKKQKKKKKKKKKLRHCHRTRRLTRNAAMTESMNQTHSQFISEQFSPLIVIDNRSLAGNAIMQVLK